MKIINGQQGLSIIELLIALAIGSFLILGVTQIYIDNKRGALFQQSQAANQESARFAELLLNEYFGKAGYRRAPDDVLEYAFPSRSADADCLEFKEGTSVTGAASGVGICLRYQPLVSGELDCTGSATRSFNDAAAFSAPNPSDLVTLAIKYVPGSALNEGVLECKNLNPASGAATYIELLSGVADFRLEFGVGPNDLLSKELRSTGDRFVPSTAWAVTAGPIRAARYSILLASRPHQRVGGSKIFDDWLANADAASVARLNADDNERIYQVANSTQTLRNLMP